MRECSGLQCVSEPNLEVSAIIELGERIELLKNKKFVFHRRSCRRVIRLVGIVVAFLQEVRDKQCVVPDSAVAVLSELHLVFTKLVDVISGCADRQGSRVWILWRSDYVTREFYLATRMVATAVDALLLDGFVDAAVDGWDYGRFAANQAWSISSKIEVDPDDRRLSEDVLQVLDQFRKGVCPPTRIIRRILDYLGIRSWTDCQENINFLERQMTMVLEEEESKVYSKIRSGSSYLLRSLLGLMNFSRSVMFNWIEENKKVDERGKGKSQLDCLNPEDFLCPISLEMMQDPVTVSTGQTYDRDSIRRWFQMGNQSCPVTGKILVSQKLIPNLVLKSLMIQKFSPRERIKDKRFPSDFSGNTVFTEAMRMLSMYLVSKLDLGSCNDIRKAVYEIRELANSYNVSRAILVEAGCIPRLLRLQASSLDPWTQVNCMVVIMTFTSHPDGLKVIFDSGGVPVVLDALCNNLNSKAQQQAAAVLAAFLADKHYRKLIEITSDTIQSLRLMLKSESTRGKEIAILTFLGILQFSSDHQKVIDSGLFDELKLLLSSNRENLVTGSLSVLNCLAKSPVGSKAILQCSSLMAAMIEILRTSAFSTVKERCLSVFVTICYTGCGVNVLLSNPNQNQTTDLMSALSSLFTDNSSRVGNTARFLLKMIQQFK